MAKGRRPARRSRRRARRSWSRRSSSPLGALVIYDSVRLGIALGRATARRPGYFPFYVGADHLRRLGWSTSSCARCSGSGEDKAFVEVGQLKLVLSVLVPTTVYVGADRLDRHLRRLRRVHRLLHALARQVRVVEGGRASASATASSSS